MNNNIFFKNNKKFNPDIDDKLQKKKNERNTSYQLKNIVDKPIIRNKIVLDEPIDLKKRIIDKESERRKLDAELSKNNQRMHIQLPPMNYNPVENISKPKQVKKNNKSDKILNDLKKLGIIK